MEKGCGLESAIRNNTAAEYDPERRCYTTEITAKPEMATEMKGEYLKSDQGHGLRESDIDQRVEEQYETCLCYGKPPKEVDPMANYLKWLQQYQA